MPSELWKVVDDFTVANHVKRSSVFQDAIKNYLMNDKGKRYRVFDFVIMLLLIIIILLLLVVVF